MTGCVFVVRLLLFLFIVCTVLSIIRRFAVVGGLTGNNALLLGFLPIGAWMIYFAYRRLWRPDADANVDRRNIPSDRILPETPAESSIAAPVVTDPSREIMRIALSRPSDRDRTTQDLTAELIEIGRRSQPASGTTWFLSSARHRAREIGEVLNERGGMNLLLQTHSRIRSALGGSSGRELEIAWDGIGDWMS